MTSWLSDASANRHIKTYVKDFLDLSGNLTVRSSEDYAWNAYGQVISGPYESDNDVQFGVDVGMDVSGLTIVVGAYQQDGANTASTNDGVVTVYRYDTTAEIWYQLGNTITGETTNGDFGFNVDINDAGTRIMATDPDANFVNVYDYNSSTNTWDKQVSITTSDGIEGVDRYGGRISGDGNTIIFGAYTYYANSGKQYVYRNTSGTTWTKIGEFTGTHTYAYIGINVQITYDGNRITGTEKDYNYDADGNYSENNGRVSIHDYSGSGTTWNQVGDWIYGATSDKFGATLDFSKDGSIFAAGTDDGDYVKVFQYDATVDGSWNLLGTTIRGPTGNRYGTNLRLSDDGTVLLVNEHRNDTLGTDNGALYIYKYTNGDWVQQGSTLYSQYTGALLGHVYGGGMSISGDGSKIVAGGFAADVNGTYSGYAQAFQWSRKYNTNPALDISNGTMTLWGGAEDISANYSVTQLGSDITASDGAADDYFSVSVGMNHEGNMVAFGAYGDDKSSSSTYNAGAVYIYKYMHGMWNEISKISPFADDTQNIYHTFGERVAFNKSGFTIVIAGRNDETSTSTDNKGAVFVYEHINGTWVQKGSTIVGDGSADLFGCSGVAINHAGNIIAASSPYGYSKVYYYDTSTNDWVQLGSTFTVTSINSSSTINFPRQVDLDSTGTIFAVGNRQASNGEIQIYKYTGTLGSGSWSAYGDPCVAKGATDYFPASVSLNSDGTVVAGGSISYDTQVGYTRVFKYSTDASNWTNYGPDIHPEDQTTYTYAGRSIALSDDGKTIVIDQSHSANNTVTYTGKTSVYKFIQGYWNFIGAQYGTDTTDKMYMVCINGDGTRCVTGANEANSKQGFARTYQITNNPALKIENSTVSISNSLNISNNVSIDGSIGIGTSSPATTFNVNGDGTLKLENHYGKGIIQDGGGDNAIYFNYGYSYYTTNLLNLHAYDDIRFFTNGYIYNQALKMTIDSDGKVGIGTSSPTGTLHIYEATGTSPGSLTGTLVLDHGDSNGISSITFPSRRNNGSDYGYISYQDDKYYSSTNERAQLTIGTSNDGDDDLVFSPSGNLGIKTSDPSYTCHVNGSYYAGSSFYYGNGTSGYIYVSAANTYSRLYFLSPTNAYCYIYAAYNAVTSDDRLKTDEEMITNATETIMKLSPQKYKMYENFDLSGNYREESGLIAQDVYYNSPELRHIVELNVDASGNIIQPLPLPDGVNTTHDIQNDPDYKALGWGDEAVGVYYYQFIPYLIKSNQEQQEKINELKSQITNLVTEITALESA